MKCNQCKADKDDTDFMEDSIRRKTCSTCRKKGQRCYRKNKEILRQSTNQWKITNQDYVKQMNEFYRTTSSFSKEDRSLLKNALKSDYST